MAKDDYYVIVAKILGRMMGQNGVSFNKRN